MNNFPILYKKSTTGKISTWQIFVENNTYYTVSGFEDGKKVTSAPNECFAKNVGKSNATTDEQQALAEAVSIYTKRLEAGYWEDVTKCGIETFYQPMLAHEWGKRESKVLYPLYAQPKLDGIRCIVKYDGMFTRKGKPIISAPHIYQSLKHLFEADPTLILDGELYADKHIIDFNTIISLTRKSKPTKTDLATSAQYIQYHVYDCPSHDGKFGKRYVYLNTLGLPNTCVLVETHLVKSKTELNDLYTKWLELNYEGQMVRVDEHYENKRSYYLLKRKEFFDAEYTITGVIEGSGNMKNKVGTLSFVTEEGKSFEAAVNGDWEYLEKLYKRNDLIGKVATVKFTEKTPDNKPRFGKVICIRDID